MFPLLFPSPRRFPPRSQEPTFRQPHPIAHFRIRSLSTCHHDVHVFHSAARWCACWNSRHVDCWCTWLCLVAAVAWLLLQVAGVCSQGLNVCVAGAAGGIGQPLSLLLKASGKFDRLSLFDIVNTPGVAADCSHVCTAGEVQGFVGADAAAAAMEGADIVVIPAGVPRKPGMTRDDLFNTNASIVAGLAKAAAQACPEAHLCIISNPVNSTVPIVAETLKAAGTYDPRRLFGVTTLDVVRANKFIGDHLGSDPAAMDVTVIGGHAGTTILPILSEVMPGADEEAIKALTHRIQFGGDEVVQAKDGAGSATLSMAYAGARFATRLADALNGASDVVECSFVESDKVDGCSFFSTRVTLGRNGVETIHDVPTLSAFEQEGLDAMKGDLAAQIQKGIDFVAKQ